MSLSVLYPWALALLPLGLLPLYFHGQRLGTYSWLPMLPEDRLSEATGIALRVLASLALVAIVLALSGVYRPAHVVERIGRGAQIVLLLDRSTSMDQPFAGGREVPPLARAGVETKALVARRLLSRFVASREGDMFSLMVFSTFPIEIVPFTQKQALIQAAIEAGRFGRGLAETNIAAGLVSALRRFESRPFRGSRVIILLSDGAGELDRPSRRQIERLMRRHRAVLYWLYVRSRNSPRILEEAEHTAVELTPERSLYRFFSAMDAPFRAYTAESPVALRDAILDVARLQNLPHRYEELVPRRDLSRWCYALGLLLGVVLTGAKLAEARAWPR